MAPIREVPIEKEMDLEVFAIVGIKRAPNRLHPIATGKEGRDVTDAELLSGRARQGWRGKMPRFDFRFQTGPFATRLQNLRVTDLWSNGDIDGNFPECGPSHVGVRVLGGAAEFVEGGAEVAERKIRLRQEKTKFGAGVGFGHSAAQERHRVRIGAVPEEFDGPGF